MPAKKKPKTSSTARECPLAADRLTINLAFFKGKKDKTARSEPVTIAMPKVASTIADRIAQRKGSVVPPSAKIYAKTSVGI
ncbi:hypothetical protein EV2_018930 [Malus domestica]